MVEQVITREKKLILEKDKVEEFIREHGEEFLLGLQIYADRISPFAGKEKIDIGNGEEYVFTGIGLCSTACTIFLDGLKEHFSQKLAVWRVHCEIKRYFPQDVSPHQWLRFKTSDGSNYFIEPSYGQIEKRPNRIVLDNISKENEYFPLDGSPVKTDFRYDRHPTVYNRNDFGSFFGE